MAKTITEIATTDTFQVWLDQTNEAINAISSECLTANNNANGATTTGNAFVVGIFGSNTITASTIRGGNVQSSANLSISSNVTVSGDWLIVDTDNEISCINSVTTGTSGQIIDSFLMASFRGGEYTITITDNGANGYQTSQLSIVHDGGAAYYTEYGIVYSNTDLGVFSANANSTHIRLVATPTVANSQVKAVRKLVKV